MRKLIAYPYLASASQQPGQQPRRPPSNPPPGLLPAPRPADYMARLQAQFDKRAERYDAGNRYHPSLAERLVQLARLRARETVLDVGAGTGYVTLPASQAVGPSGSVTALDLSAPMLKQAQQKAAAAGLHHIAFQVADVDDCVFSPATFDAILCSSTLPFLPNIPASLARWHGWLRSGGRVVFNVPQGMGSRAFAVFAALAAQRGLLLRDPSADFGDKQDVQAMLQAAGYARCELESSEEVNARAGTTPQQWAAAGWEQCLGMPFADLTALLPVGEVEAMREEYLSEATQLAEGFIAGDGIAEPYVMLWVVAHR